MRRFVGVVDLFTSCLQGNYLIIYIKFNKLMAERVGFEPTVPL